VKEVKKVAPSEAVFTENDVEEAKLVAYIETCLRNEANKLSKKQKQVQANELLILNQAISADLGDEKLEMIETIPSNDDDMEELESNTTIQYALSLLTKQQRMVIEATILDGISQKEVALKLGFLSQP
jgi:RNA polymerase sigma factor (sigma-70 family)